MPILLSLDSTSKNTSRYQLESSTSYNLLVSGATYEDDGVFECEAGRDTRSARVYVYGEYYLQSKRHMIIHTCVSNVYNFTFDTEVHWQ